MFSEVRKKGEGRLRGQRFGIMGGLGCHAKELGLYRAGSGEPWVDHRVDWIGEVRNLAALFFFFFLN